jgi:ABC-type transport system involved in cytochrome c biogenesis permease component
MVFVKDIRIELATREIVVTTGFFAALVTILTSVAFTTGPAATTRVAPGTLWLAILFSSILALGGAGRGSAKSRRSWDFSSRLCPAPPSGWARRPGSSRS